MDRPRRHPLHGGPPRKQRRRGPARDRLVRPARAQPGRVRLLVGRRQELEEDQVRSINIVTMSQYVFLVMGKEIKNLTIFATCLRWDGDGMGTNEFKYFYHTFTMFLVVGWEIFEFEYFCHIFTMFFW